MTTHLIGEKVYRRIDPYDIKSLIKIGTIINIRDCYSTLIKIYYPEIYDVKWDDGQIQKGFLWHGLSKYVDETYEE